ncbi:MAG: hypothetical protein ACTSUD_01310, partial [Alphaproteobacteria bacterium]
LIPICAIGSIYTLAISEAWVVSALQTKGVRHTTASLLQVGIRVLAIVVFVIPVAIRGYSDIYAKAANIDSRIDAGDWIIQNIPRHSTVLLESYAPALAINDFDVVIAFGSRFVRWTDISETARPNGYFGNIGSEMKTTGRCDILRSLYSAGVNYVVLSSWIGRFEKSGAAYRFEVGVYQSIIEAGEIMETFIPDENGTGPPIYIYKVKSSELFDDCELDLKPRSAEP